MVGISVVEGGCGHQKPAFLKPQTDVKEEAIHICNSLKEKCAAIPPTPVETTSLPLPHKICCMAKKTAGKAQRFVKDDRKSDSNSLLER